MVTDRFMEQRDIPLVEGSLLRDACHVGTTPEFFTKPGTVCKVYEDDQGPICFVRGCPALRLDIQYLDNNDKRRNMTAMLEGFDKLAKKAQANGFHEIIFQTNNDLLRRFCVRRFGFIESAGELRKYLL